MTLSKTKLLAGLFCLSVSGLQAQEAPQLRSDNIDQVVKSMTLEEKASMVVGFTQGNHYWGIPTVSDPNDKELVQGAAGQTGTVKRLGIPHTVVADGPAGLRINPTRPNTDQTFYCTGFPVGTCLASSWNTELVNHVGTAMGNELIEYGVDVLLAPGMNIHRNPLCGRNFEYFSEDPVVSGKIAAAYINGIQSQGVGVSAKHFAVNNQESNRINNDAVISQRALREIYLKGYEIMVKESQPWTVMSSYNKINGVFTQESPELLTTILRDEWHFDGIVMTDWTACRNTAAQLHAGNDLMMPGAKEQIDEILAKVKSGELAESDLDICLKRVLEYVVKTPRFKGYKYSNQPDLKAHADITRKSATEGMVLLKNDRQTLPLKSDAHVALFGITSYSFIAGGTGSGNVNKAYVVDLNQGLTNAGFAIDSSLAQIYSQYMAYEKSIEHIELGPKADLSFFCLPRLREADFNNAVYKTYAKTADVAIITIGRNAGEGADRFIKNDFEMTDEEQRMIKGVCDAFHAQNKSVVVILNIGGVIETASWKSLPDAILLAWQPGQEGGNSVADVLCGKSYPSGKLTMTFPDKFFDHPSSANFPLDYDFTNDWIMSKEQINAMPHVGTTRYDEGIYVGYRYFNTASQSVSYPFGFGLGYTQFDYSNAKISKSGNTYKATVTIKNTGKAVGKEVVELYVSAPDSPLEKPSCELKAFAKTRELKPGESQTLTMTFTNYDLGSFNESQQAWITEAGTYQALFGASVEDIRATANFKASTGKTQCHDVLKPVQELHELSLTK